MKKIGLDLGSSSIGWSLRDLDNVFESGVITFQSGMIKGTGGYSSPTKDRREARSKRKLIQARKYRKWELLEILLNNFVPLDKTELENWSKYKKGQVKKFPENPNFLKWLKCDFSYLNDETKYNNPYELRVNALDNKKKLHKHELGRILYHLVQRRGYKDIGETDKETEKQKERRGTGGFQKALKENRTIAEALQKEFLDKGLRARNQYPYREEYKDELEEILKAQGYNITEKDGKYEDEWVQQIWKAIIWQRPLKSQKGNIGKCTLEPTKPRCPVSHPIFEIFRAWSFINTIKYYNDKNEKVSLGQTERELLFEFFLKKDKNFKFEDIKKELNKSLDKNTKYNYPIDKKTGKYDTTVAGMPVCKGLIDVFGETVKNVLKNIHQYNIGNAPKIINGYSIYDLWHILFAFDEKTATDQKFLEKFAVQKLNLAVVQDAKNKEINLPEKFAKLRSNIIQGYSDLGLKAMCKIIPFLKEGYLYNEAVVLAKLPELLGEKWERQKDSIKKLVKQANKIYNYQKAITAITNKLIDNYKGLVDKYKEDNTPVEAYKDFTYKLKSDDINNVKNVCIGHFGEKSWNEKDKDEKIQILKSVEENYQAFFYDEKRAYRTTPLLTDIFKELLKQHKIEFKGDLYHHSNIENKYGTTIFDRKTGAEILPEARIDSIKNPMFNKSMSILRKLINQLILEGKVDKETEVVVELARELNDNNKRSAIERYQNERKNNREKYRVFLQEFNEKENKNINVEESLSTFELWTEQIFDETIIKDEKGKEKRENNNSLILKEKEAVKRYELWTEQKGQCMYTGKMISITQLFSTDIDIMHTIARSLLPDNTMANKTVGFKFYNTDLQKTKLPTQCDNYTKDVEGWGTAIEPRLGIWIEKRDNFKKLYGDRLKPKGGEDETKKNKRIQEKHYYKMHYDYWKDKVERFTAEEIKDSWVRRQLVDTQMTSKYTREFLKTFFKKVSVQKGETTSDFRKIYGFQEEDEIKNRNRHTHHAIDATVLTLIPVNSSYRDKILKKYYEEVEAQQKITNRKPFENFNSQKLIQEIENSTLIVNYESNKILKQTAKNVRKRGKLQFLKDKQGKFVLDENNNKIQLIAKGDTVRSELYAQTYLGKIKDVERYGDGQPKREGSNWEYKTGKDEFLFVVRKPIKDVLSKIDDIIDPAIRELVRKQKNNSEIKDYQGNIIRHVRVKTSIGKEVKERVNYRSKHDYKNKFYSTSGSLPYAILVQKGTERAMLPIASFELAKEYKKYGSFVIDEYLKKYDEENKTSLSSYSDKKLLKVGQKVLVLKEDEEFEKRNDIDFQKNRMYVITQFSEGSIWLKYHLEAQSLDEIKKTISRTKDRLLRKYEIEQDIPEVVEDVTIQDNKLRKEDYENRKYRFDTINNSFRLKMLSDKIGLDKTNEIKKELDKYKAIAGTIEVEEKTPLLKMSKSNWNFLYENENFEISLLGKIKWIEK